MLYLSTILLSVFITVSLIPAMTRIAGRLQMVDFPDLRKVHALPVPRIGGLAMAIGMIIPVALWARGDDFLRAYLAGAGIIVVFGLADDLKGLGYKAKFLGQVLATLVIVVYGSVRIDSLGSLFPGAAHLTKLLAIPLTVAAVVGVTNAVNLSDGLDGLAGGISLLVFCCIGYLAYLGGDKVVLLLSLSLAGAIFGFLRFNTYPASLFMGDTGSQLLGFSAIALSIKITQGDYPFSRVLPLIILGFPVLDTLTVMVQRVREGRSPFSPDKNHFHHRLVRLGLYHTEAVFTIYVVQAAMIVAAILFRYHNDLTLMISYMGLSAFIVGAFFIAERTGVRIKRYPLIDRVVKGRLRQIRDHKRIGKISLIIAQAIIPLPLLCSCLFMANVPRYVTVIAGCFSFVIITGWILARRYMGFWLRSVLYMIVPVVLYLIEMERATWMSAGAFTIYHLCFGIIAFFVLLAVKFAGKTKGFRITTMDFLIIFIAVIVPNLPDQSIQSYHLGALTVEIITLLFSYEFLVTELREKFGPLSVSTLLSLVLIALRGGMGY